MKQFTYTILIQVSLLLSGLLLPSSCLVDESPYGDEEGTVIEGLEDAEETEVKVTMGLPLSLTSATRSLTDNQESEIQEIQMLVFEPGGGKYLYTAHTTKIETPDLSQPRFKEVNIKLLNGILDENKYDIILLTNARDIITGLFPGGIPKVNKNEVIESLVFASQDRIIVGANGTYSLIPMWGKIDGVELLPGEDLTEDPVELIRMVAKTDVTVTGDALQKFTLTSVHVYNYWDGGYLVPLSEDWVGDGTDVPYIPGTAQMKKGPIAYTGITGNKIENTIYLFEASKGTTSLQNNTSLVIGGVYQNQTYYYRMDLVDDNDNYIPLIRNYRYDVRIKDVKGPGYLHPDTAFMSAPFNLEAEVIRWNDTQMKEFVVDGQYIISLSEGSFTFSREKRTYTSPDNKLSIQTDYPTGWYILKSSLLDDETRRTPTWLQIGDQEGGLITSGDSYQWPSTKKKQIDLLVESNEHVGATTRSATFVVRAGRLEYTVSVVQTTDANANVSIYVLNEQEREITYLEFPGKNAADKTVTLIWSPPTETLSVKQVDPITGEGFSFLNNNAIFYTGQTIAGYPEDGKRIFTIRPADMTDAEITANPFLEKTSMVRFYIEYADKRAEKDFYLRQINQGLVADVKDSYIADGSEYSFTVRSNVAWTAELTDKGGVVSDLLTQQGGPNTVGTTVRFKTYDAENDGTAVVIFKAVNGEFSDVTVRLNCIGGFRLATPDKLNSYTADGSQYSFTAVGSRAWTAALQSDGGVVQSIQTTAGEVTNFSFTTKKTSNAGTAIVRFRPVSGSGYVDVEINCVGIGFDVSPRTFSGITADGTQKSIRITANDDWTATIKNNGGVLQSIDTPSGTATTSTFLFTPQATTSSGTATVTFTSVNLGGSVDVTISCTGLTEVRKNPSNSYLLQPGGIGILIPVSRANEYKTNTIGAGTSFTAELVWTDNPNCIQSFAPVGTGSSGYIRVVPGTGEGNAVIAVKVGGVIKWSWHIWVVNYDPTDAPSTTVVGGTTFMDRNLGATASSGVYMPGRYGLHYQWGRKDPFPSSSNTNYNATPIAERDIYNGAGQPVSIKIKENHAINVVTTVDDGIENPLTFYTGSANWQNAPSERLWGPDVAKGLHDPCPEGWRVPAERDVRFISTATGVGHISTNGVSINYYSSTLFLYYSYYRDHQDGKLKEGFVRTGYSSHYWTTDFGPANTNRNAIGISSIGQATANVTTSMQVGDVYFYHSPAHGFSIRCVAE